MSTPRIRNVSWFNTALALLLLHCGSAAPPTSNTAGGAGSPDAEVGGSPTMAGASGSAGSDFAGGGTAAAASGALNDGGVSALGGASGSAASPMGGAGSSSAGGGGASSSSAAGASGMPSQCDTGGGVPQSSTATLFASGFDSGKLTPYNECTTTSPNLAEAATLNGQPSAKLYWQQAGYDGTRLKRGAEACSSLAFYKEGWYGLKFYLPSPGFPSDKTLGIAQIFSQGGCNSWAAMLQIQNDELWIEHRGNCASPAEYRSQLATHLPHNAWLPIVMHFNASHAGAGALEAWYGDAVCTPSLPTYRKTGINLGFGDWTGDSLTAAQSNQIGLKFGMYNFDSGNYTAAETRTIYYDNVSQLVGNPPNAFATVKPIR